MGSNPGCVVHVLSILAWVFQLPPTVQKHKWLNEDSKLAVDVNMATATD